MEKIESVLKELTKLPGVGDKSAERILFLLYL
ncbi:hypothetical protein I6I92_09010 [Peptoniphilus asaccharolyticus]|nr:hypothetical protein [Peptoniphilus asaccharolyticus]